MRLVEGLCRERDSGTVIVTYILLIRRVGGGNVVHPVQRALERALEERDP